MILKVFHWQTVSGKLSNYKVIYDSGVMRSYKDVDLPDTVRTFIKGHKAQTKLYNGSVIRKVYVYDKVRTGNK